MFFLFFKRNCVKTSTPPQMTIIAHQFTSQESESLELPTGWIVNFVLLANNGNGTVARNK